MHDSVMLSRGHVQSSGFADGGARVEQGISTPARLTTRTLRRGALACLCLLVGLLAFGVIQRLSSSFHSLQCAVDKYVPFVPGAVVIYLSFFLLLPFCALIIPDDQFKVTLRASSTAALIAFAVYILYPTEHAAHPLGVIESGWLVRVYQCVHMIDRRTNCFPSLHVALSIIIAIGVTRSRPQLGFPVWVVATGIIISSVLTKQHYAADTIGGMVLAIGVSTHWGCRRTEAGTLGSTETPAP